MPLFIATQSKLIHKNIQKTFFSNVLSLFLSLSLCLSLCVSLSLYLSSPDVAKYHILSKTSYSEDKWRCHQAGRRRQTREDRTIYRATQPLSGLLEG